MDEDQELVAFARNNDPPSLTAWDLYHPTLQRIWRERGLAPARTYLVEVRRVQYGWFLAEAPNPQLAQEALPVAMEIPEGQKGHVHWHKADEPMVTTVSLQHAGEPCLT